MDHEAGIDSAVFSNDSALLALASKDRVIKIWDPSSDICLRTLGDYLDRISSIVFSYDLALVASLFFDKTVKIWLTSIGQCIYSIQADIWDLPSLRVVDLAHVVTENTFTDVTKTGMHYWFQSVESNHVEYSCIERSSNNTWITNNGEHAVWLPIEYRPGSNNRDRWTVSGKSIAVAINSGSIWICQFHDKRD